MAIFIEEPLPDETLFSVVARYLIEARVDNHRAFLARLMGPGFMLSAGVAIGLGRMATETAMAWGMDEVQIRDRLTLHPYYAALCSANTGGLLWEDGSMRSQLLQRIAPGRLGLRHCELCWRMDSSTGTPRYWRRAHQLPGVIVCLTHRCPLNYSGSGAGRCLLETAMRFDSGRPINPAGSDVQRDARYRFGRLCVSMLQERTRSCRYLERNVRIECARTIGYAARDSVDIARMASDLSTALGPAYFEQLGIPLHSCRRLGHAFYRRKSMPCDSLIFMLLEFFLQDRVERMKISGSPICPRATSARDREHHLKLTYCCDEGRHYLCSCSLSFLFRSDPVTDTSVVVPTQDGSDLSLVATFLVKRGYSVDRIAKTLGIGKSVVERMLTSRIEVEPWRLRTERARRLVAWIELVDRCGTADAALATEGRRWRAIGALCRSLPDKLIPSGCRVLAGSKKIRGER